MDKIIKDLIAYRKRISLSQAALAARMGVQQSAIARIEAGRTSPKLTTIRQMADAMHLSIHLSPEGSKAPHESLENV